LCNTGTEPVRVMEILTPGGFEGYFDEYEKIVSKLASGESTRRSTGGRGASLANATALFGTTSASPRPEPASASDLSRAIVPTLDHPPALFTLVRGETVRKAS
jgi:hypothetical protein